MTINLPVQPRYKSRVIEPGSKHCQHYYVFDERNRGVCQKCGRVVDCRVQEPPVKVGVIEALFAPEFVRHVNIIERHISLPEGHLLYGNGCRLDGVDYECLENCPFADDCRAPRKSWRMSK